MVSKPEPYAEARKAEYTGCSFHTVSFTAESWQAVGQGFGVRVRVAVRVRVTVKLEGQACHEREGAVNYTQRCVVRLRKGTPNM